MPLLVAALLAQAKFTTDPENLAGIPFAFN
jgi:hypothetical protein